jgi:hypothetical protein
MVASAGNTQQKQYQKHRECAHPVHDIFVRAFDSQ